MRSGSPHLDARAKPVRRARAGAQALTLAVLTALGGGGAGCSSTIQHDLDERAANEVLTALEKIGIGTQKIHASGSAGGGSEGGFSIRVAQADASRALDLLRSLGLPRVRRHGFTEVYGRPSLIPSASEERARYLDALGGEIERTLETVEGVVAARVHLVLAETDPLAIDGKPHVPARAAVLLKARTGRPPLAETEVQRLVAGSVPGLDPAAVAVVVTASQDAVETGGGAMAAVGPFRVSPGSRPGLLAALAGVLGLVGALAVLLLSTVRRLTAAQRAAAAKSLD